MDQEVQLSDSTFASFPKIFNQLWVMPAEVEERGNFVHALKIIKIEIQIIVLEEQETRPTLAGRLPKEPVVSIRPKNPKLVLLDFEAA
ncbi:hypothetical protein DSO57_1033166 [Entomophthora muscae]|uniref:Uncharacterized protein n=1 Tax=Entomophthora muscae TaxID=34485 RepID=A0ACC2TBB0_9FUNG|nr:hypothetical protein DSO57_1033166 [Entomophthora muscae]